QPQPQYQAPPSDSGRVISSTPIIQQVAVPRQVCSQQPMLVQAPRNTSGAGSIIGAIAGGLLGNTIGHGGGRAAATALGVMGGALVGNSVEANGSPAYAQNVQQCSTQTSYENRTVAYNVTYEYAGRQYTVQMPQDPGPTVRLQVTPIAAGNPEPVYSGSAVSTSEGVPILRSVDMDPAPVVYSAPTVVPAPIVLAAPPVYSAYGYQPYYPPLGISLNLGYSRGGHRHGHRHWR
ncbi:MAG: glycine zipper 2TM domain-containing protein, partial [Comamonadaceae bacterium]